MRRFALLLVLVACSKKPASKPIDAGPTVLEPMEIADPPKPSASSYPNPGPAPWAMQYNDKDDLPDDAGSNGRCYGAGTMDASVSLQIIRSGTGIDLVVPMTNTMKHLWQSSPQGVGSCSASATSEVIRFHCGEDLASIDGKIYKRGSNVIVSYQSSVTGLKHETVYLPCGSRPKLEPILCPRMCRETDAGCGCEPIGVAPAPSASR